MISTAEVASAKDRLRAVKRIREMGYSLDGDPISLPHGFDVYRYVMLRNGKPFARKVLIVHPISTDSQAIPEEWV
ncbi:hypothetical protein WDZ92_41055, partial [Nostoc sp. NIES-2111]